MSTCTSLCNLGIIKSPTFLPRAHTCVIPLKAHKHRVKKIELTSYALRRNFAPCAPSQKKQIKIFHNNFPEMMIAPLSLLSNALIPCYKVCTNRKMWLFNELSVVPLSSSVVPLSRWNAHGAAGPIFWSATGTELSSFATFRITHLFPPCFSLLISVSKPWFPPLKQQQASSNPSATTGCHTNLELKPDAARHSGFDAIPNLVWLLRLRRRRRRCWRVD